MFWHIDPANGVAVYEQIARQIKYAVAEGTLLPSELIPSVRELARELAINPNTVARAYGQLQTDGVLVSIRGMGLAIAEQAVRACRDARRELLAERMRQVVSEALRSGLTASEIEKLFQQQLRKMERTTEKGS